MPDWLVLQHQDDCPPGILGDWAGERGVALDVIRPDRGELRDAASYDMVCVLGSDRSVNHDQPWIVEELAWLRGAVNAAPVFGICFGAQALTVALGGEVHSEPPEIDWLELDAENGFPTGPWLCWHNDFITAPPGASVLARTARATHAFRRGPHLGVQFHPEVTPAIVDDWMRAADLGRDLARGGVDHDALRAKTAALAPQAVPHAFGLFDQVLAAQT